MTKSTDLLLNQPEREREGERERGREKGMERERGRKREIETIMLKVSNPFH